MDLERIEVKYAIAPEHADAAFAALNLDDDELEERSIVFFDTEDLSLFTRGIILRARFSEDEGDSTFKVRGDGAAAAWAKLADRIEDAGSKLEGDQNVGSDVRPSFSITRPQDPETISSVVDVASLFGDEVDALLPELHAMKVKRFGPFTSRTWKTKIKGLGKVTIELWVSERLRLLEISDKKDAGDEASDFEHNLGERMSAMGLAQLPGSKTERALRA